MARGYDKEAERVPFSGGAEPPLPRYVRWLALALFVASVVIGAGIATMIKG